MVSIVKIFIFALLNNKGSSIVKQMNDNEIRRALRCIGLIRIRVKNQLERCWRLMQDNKGSLEMEVNGFLDLLNELDKMERELKKIKQ